MLELHVGFFACSHPPAETVIVQLYFNETKNKNEV